VSEQERRHDPADPLVEDDDLLSPSSHGGESESDELNAQAPDPSAEPDEEASAGDEEQQPREPQTRPRRPLLAVGWSIVVVLLVFAVLVFAELLRVTSALNDADCVARAEANYMAETSPHITPQGSALVRLGFRIAIKSCG